MVRNNILQMLTALLLCCESIVGSAATFELAATTTSSKLIDHELATIFLTTAPQVALAHRNTEMATRLQPLAIRQAGYLISLLHPTTGLTGAQSITSSNSNEHGIRPNTRSINGLAMMVRSLPDEAFPTTLTRAMCRDHALQMLRFVLPTHGAGGLPCADGKLWKDQWQSALWANSAGLGAWLLWDELTPEMRWLAARMISDEADRFVGKTPPSQVADDTKAEENAWNSTVISLAACMFPNHPNHKKWRETAATWAVSSFVREADLITSTTIDGATLAERGLGPTLHNDYTMENHHRVHPDYMNTINICLEQWAPYSWAGLPAPEAIQFNTRKVYGNLRALTFPDAGYLYINGQDWQLHRNPQWLPTYALQAIFYNDGEAAMLARRALEVNELMMARSADGGVFLPEEFKFPSSQSDTLEMYMAVFLAIAAKGEGAAPVDEATYWRDLSGVHLYEAGKFAVVRTEHSIATFSWGDQPMGMVLPLQKDLLFSPNERNLIGLIGGEDITREQPKVIEAHPRMVGNNFAITGTLSRANGAIDQRFAFVAMSDGRVVYVDDLLVKKEIRNPQINLGTMTVLNDKNWVYHDGSRHLFWPKGFPRGNKGQVEFDVNDKASTTPWTLDSPWYNLDNCFGVIIPASGGIQRYVDNRKIGNGRLEQPFHLTSLQHHTKTLEPSSEPFTWETLVFFPGQSTAETEAIADTVKCKWPEPGVCLLVMDDVRFQIDLRHVSTDDGVHISYSPRPAQRTPGSAMNRSTPK